ncbi:MAG: TIGR03905 family TSCPD domain-containing protein [Oscillospiraceae bacterium]|nr:TIGR03905 family TSCPD domain-containing protein [Candidatus Limimonas egerieequi]
MRYTYRTQGTCSQEISFDIDENKVVTDISFYGGCNGNLKAIAVAVDGKTADEIYDLFHGITCGFKPTSCSDQLAKAVMEAAKHV